MNATTPDTIATRCRAHRERLGYSLREAVRVAGDRGHKLSVASLSDLETGKTDQARLPVATLAGLAAAYATSVPALLGEPEGHTMPVPFERLEPWALNPRGAIAPDDPGIIELADSIAAKGLMENLVARPQPRGDRLDIIAGNRRWEAIGRLREDGRWPEDRPLPVRVIEADDTTARALAIIENLQRVDLNPMQEADAFAAWQDGTGESAGAIARAIGKTPRFVQQRLDLVRRLVPAARDLVRSGRMLPTVGRELAREPEERQTWLVSLAVGKAGHLLTDTGEVRQLLAERKGTAAPPADAPDPALPFDSPPAAEGERPDDAHPPAGPARPAPREESAPRAGAGSGEQVGGFEADPVPAPEETAPDPTTESILAGATKRQEAEAARAREVTAVLPELRRFTNELRREVTAAGNLDLALRLLAFELLTQHTGPVSLLADFDADLHHAAEAGRSPATGTHSRLALDNLWSLLVNRPRAAVLQLLQVVTAERLLSPIRHLEGTTPDQRGRFYLDLGWQLNVSPPAHLESRMRGGKVDSDPEDGGAGDSGGDGGGDTPPAAPAAAAAAAADGDDSALDIPAFLRRAQPATASGRPLAAQTGQARPAEPRLRGVRPPVAQTGQARPAEPRP